MPAADDRKHEGRLAVSITLLLGLCSTPSPFDTSPAPTAKGFIAFEPTAAITNALNLAHRGVYKDLQSIPPGGSWEESFWITTKGY
jgi:hypothetical protein